MSTPIQMHFLGEIVHVGFTSTVFTNYLPCDGRLLPINQNTALFSLLGTRFGGDGMRTFAVPDLNRSAPKETMYFICVASGLYPK